MSFANHVGQAMKLVAEDVQSVVIPDTGHFLADESPDELLAALTPFLAPCRDESAAAHDATPHAAAASQLTRRHSVRTLPCRGVSDRRSLRPRRCLGRSRSTVAHAARRVGPPPSAISHSDHTM
jgi:hypothetical protein